MYFTFVFFCKKSIWECQRISHYDFLDLNKYYRIKANKSSVKSTQVSSDTIVLGSLFNKKKS